MNSPMNIEIAEDSTKSVKYTVITGDKSERIYTVNVTVLPNTHELN